MRPVNVHPFYGRGWGIGRGVAWGASRLIMAARSSIFWFAAFVSLNWRFRSEELVVMFEVHDGPQNRSHPFCVGLRGQVDRGEGEIFLVTKRPVGRSLGVHPPP